MITIFGQDYRINRMKKDFEEWVLGNHAIVRMGYSGDTESHTTLSQNQGTIASLSRPEGPKFQSPGQERQEAFAGLGYITKNRGLKGRNKGLRRFLSKDQSFTEK